jgi:hypothetical protein
MSKYKLLLVSVVFMSIIASAVTISCTVNVAPEPPPPPPPAGVPAAPNDSIVTARVIAVNKLSDDMPWEIILEIQDSKDVPGFGNRTSDKVGQQLAVKTSEDVAQLKAGQEITAHVKLVGDERIRMYLASGIR